MTQPPEAVGGATNDTVVAAEPTLEDRFAAVASEEQADPAPEAPESEEAPDSASEPTEDDIELEAEQPEEVEAPIQPPVSLTAEEKEQFKDLPLDAQKMIARRVGELEKGLHTKAQEAAKTRLTVETQAFEHITALQNTQIGVLQSLLPQIPEKPSPRLQIEDPYAYADHLEAHDWAVAQHNSVAQQIQAIQQQQNQNQQVMKLQADQVTNQILQTEFPEYLDPEKGPELRKALGSTALALGYSDDRLANVDGQDVLAMRKANEWRVKADKYDALMAKQMERVREAKTLPTVTRPGAAQPKGAAANQRYQADRQAMRNGDKDAGVRVFAQFLK